MVVKLINAEGRFGYIMDTWSSIRSSIDDNHLYISTSDNKSILFNREIFCFLSPVLSSLIKGTFQESCCRTNYETYVILPHVSSKAVYDLQSLMIEGTVSGLSGHDAKELKSLHSFLGFKSVIVKEESDDEITVEHEYRIEDDRTDGDGGYDGDNEGGEGNQDDGSSAPEVSHQGQVATEECSPTNPHTETSYYNSNICPLSTGKETHDDTCNGEVEVGDAAHYNVDYGTNEHGEDVRPRDVDETEGRGLSIEQVKNGRPISTKKQIREEKVDPISNVIITKVAEGPDVVHNNELSMHDCYEQNEENDMIMAQDHHNHTEVDTMVSMNSFGDKEDMVDSNFDMVDTEVVDSAFINEEMAQNSGDDNMMPDEEQDLVLPFEEKEFQCLFCTETFGTSTELKKHKRNHHGQKAFQCSVCLKMFSRLDHLYRHKRLHEGGKSYQCSLCSKMFSQSGNLNLHMRVHAGEKPYQCSFCTKTFSWPSDLIHHKRVHTGERPYQCSLCPKTFSQLGNLNQHNKKFHSGGSNVKKDKSVHTLEKPHQCSLCYERFSRMIELKRHMCCGK